MSKANRWNAGTNGGFLYVVAAEDYDREVRDLTDTINAQAEQIAALSAGHSPSETLNAQLVTLRAQASKLREQRDELLIDRMSPAAGLAMRELWDEEVRKLEGKP